MSDDGVPEPSAAAPGSPAPGSPRLRLLGPVTLFGPAGDAVRVGGPRAQAILAVLASQPGEVVTAGRLIDQVWGERVPHSGRVTVQSYVYRLRSISADVARMLPRRPEGYLLDPSAVDVDVDRFTRLSERTRSAAADHRWADALERSREAGALWDGDPFTGLDDVRLLEFERERLRELRAENRLIGLEARLELTGAADVLGELRELVESDRWDERARRLLVRALYRAGRQTEALEAVAVARRELREEHGLEPSPELAELTERILNHDPSLRGPDPVAGPPGGSSRGAGAADRAGTAAPAGRERDRARLRDAWDAVRAGGRAALLLVEGEPGVGKTYLVEHVVAEQAGAGDAVRTGRCLDRPRLPLQPWSDMVEDPPQPGGTPAGPVGEPLTDLWEVAAHRVFREVVGTVRAATGRAPLLLVLEDLQWAEVAALRLLEHVLDRCADEPLLVLATVRSAVAGCSPQAAAVLARLRHRPSTGVLSLSGLDAGDLGRMLAAHGVRVGPDEAEAVRARTDGIPLLALEAVRGGGDVVAGLLDTVGGAADVAELLAVAGGRHGPAVLSRACGLDLSGLDDALGRLVDAGLVRPVPGGPVEYEFSHVLYREAIEARMSPLRQVMLSRSLIAAADALPGRVRATVLARRAVVVARSGEPDDVRRARAECRRAAARSSACHDHRDAVSWLDSAVGLGPAEQGPEWTDLLTERGLALRRAGSADARAAFLCAAASARELGDRTRLARIGVGWSRGFCSRTGAVDAELVATLRAAASGTGPLPDGLHAMVLAALAAELVWDPDGDERFVLADTALDRARADGDRDVLAYVLRSRHLTMDAADTLDVLRRDTDELMELAGPDADVGLRFEALLHRTGPAIGDGDTPRIRALLAHAGRIADQLGQPTLQWQIGWSRASMLLWEGALAEAASLSAETAARAAATEYRDEVALFRLSQELELCRLRGGLGAHLPALLDVPAGAPDAFQTARYLCAAGRPDAAEAHLAAVPLHDGRLRLRRHMLERPSLDNLVCLAAELHRPDLAAAARDRLEPFADTFGHTIVAHPVGQHWLGVAELTLDRPSEAEARLRRAVARHVECGLPVPEAESRAELARAYDLLGDTGRASDERSVATRIAARHGAAELARAIHADAARPARRRYEPQRAGHG